MPGAGGPRVSSRSACRRGAVRPGRGLHRVNVVVVRARVIGVCGHHPLERGDDGVRAGLPVCPSHRRAAMDAGSSGSRHRASPTSGSSGYVFDNFAHRRRSTPAPAAPDRRSDSPHNALTTQQSDACSTAAAVGWRGPGRRPGACTLWPRSAGAGSLMLVPSASAMPQCGIGARSSSAAARANERNDSS